MLTIIGLILRIIGIILGSLAGLLLLAILLVLFVPLRYCGRLMIKPEVRNIEFGVGWLFRLVSVRLLWTGETPKVTVRIARILFFDNTRPKKEKRIKTRDKEKVLEEPANEKRLEDGHETAVESDRTEPEREEREAVVEPDRTEPEKEECEAGMELEEEHETAFNAEKAETQEKESANTVSKDQLEADEEKQEQESEKCRKNIFIKLFSVIKAILTYILSVMQRFVLLLHQMIDFFKNLKEHLKNLAQKLRVLCTKTGLIRAFLRDTDNRSGISAIIRMLIQLFKYVLPYRLTGKVIFGTGDAYTTGQVLVYAGMFYGLYGNNFNLEADFEEKRLEIEVKLKGRIRPVKLLLYFFRLWKTAEFKKLLKNVRKLKEEL